MSLEASNGVNLPRAKIQNKGMITKFSQIAPLEVAVLASTISNMMLNLHKFKENVLHIAPKECILCTTAENWYKQGAQKIKYRNI